MPESEAECEMKSMIVLYKIEHEATDVTLLKVLDHNTKEQEYVWGCPAIKCNMKLVLD